MSLNTQLDQRNAQISDMNRQLIEKDVAVIEWIKTRMRLNACEIPKRVMPHHGI